SRLIGGTRLAVLPATVVLGPWHFFCVLARGPSCCSASFAGRGTGLDAPRGAGGAVSRALDSDAAGSFRRGVSLQSHVCRGGRDQLSVTGGTLDGTATNEKRPLKTADVQAGRRLSRRLGQREDGERRHAEVATAERLGNVGLNALAARPGGLAAVDALSTLRCCLRRSRSNDFRPRPSRRLRLLQGRTGHDEDSPKERNGWLRPRPGGEEAAPGREEVGGGAGRAPFPGLSEWGEESAPAVDERHRGATLDPTRPSSGRGGGRTNLATER
ncbi:hypothetical protein THAOC_08348, partial [Thalassiosira oceanica]